jgi:hypothetical protein
MDEWRDDLPPIPSERIRAEAIREGHRRREARYQRQRALLYGGMGVGAVGLIVAGALISISAGGDDDDGDDAAARTEAPANGAAADTTAAASETTTGGTTAGTAATASTGAASGTSTAPGTAAGGTEAPGTTAAGAATTSPDYTTIGGSIAALPPSDAVIVATSTQIWEQASGVDCGATLLTIIFDPGTQTPQSPVLHWETAGVRDQAPMEILAGDATRTIGPFPADTLDDGTVHEVLAYVTDAEATGEQVFRGPTVILRDCSP